MDGAACHDKTMPDRVIEGNAIIDVKEDAEGVGEPAYGHHDERAQGDVGDGRLNGDEHDPAHGNVHGCRNAVKASCEKSLEAAAYAGDAPLHAEKRPAPARRVAHGHQQEGGVGARDKQVDGAVIENA